MMKYFSSFAGVEGIGQGLPENWDCVGFSEIHKGAASVLKYHYPTIKNYGDITKIDWAIVPDFDVLIGGSPCQDLSVAGKRAGLEGAKSSLFFEYVRALREKKPEYFLWENVAGALSSQEGWDFAEVQTQMAESGYSLWWQLLNAADFGVPQNRTRILIIGARTKSIPEILFEQIGNIGNATEKFHSEEISKSLTTNASRQDPTAQTYVANTITTRQSPPTKTQLRAYENYIANPIKTHSGGSQIEETYIGEAKVGIRRLTPLESERVMSWPDNWTRWGINEKEEVVELSDAQRYFMCGNGVASKMIEGIFSQITL